MPQPLLRRPFGVFHTRDQFWLHPMVRLVGIRNFVESASSDFALLQHFPNRFLRIPIKTGTNVADKSELLTFVQTQQQRAKPQSWCARIGPASNSRVNRCGLFDLY